MSNYYSHYRGPYTTAWNPPRQVQKSMNEQPANRLVELDYQKATKVYLGDGFKRYYWYWNNEVRIYGNEYVDIRLIGQEGETVISAGFSIGNPFAAHRQNVYAVTTSPIYQHIMAITLHSAEPANVESKVEMWLLVKELK